MDAPATLAVSPLTVWVSGRPAPKGSKKRGEHGQMRDSSPYLPAWAGSWTGVGRNRRRVAGAVERAVYERYQELGVEPDQLPLFRGPVGVQISFLLDPDRRIDGPPDADKLERATWDALTIARVWEDDARVVSATAQKQHADWRGTGALILVWAVTLPAAVQAPAEDADCQHEAWEACGEGGQWWRRCTDCGHGWAVTPLSDECQHPFESHELIDDDCRERCRACGHTWWIPGEPGQAGVAL